jgi:hypothetical protein
MTAGDGEIFENPGNGSAAEMLPGSPVLPI